MWRRKKEQVKQAKVAAAAASIVGAPVDLGGVDDLFIGIRYNRNTQLENQKLALSLLDATEATLKEKKLSYEPENYFLALWPLIDNGEKEDAGQMTKTKALDFNTAAIYLVSFVAPKLGREFLHENYSTIYAKLPEALSRFLEVAPFVRGIILVLKAVLGAFEEELWKEKPSLTEMLDFLLQLALDARPKVRKLAQDALLALIRNGVFGPSHPAKATLVQFLSNILAQTTRKDSSNALYAIPLLRSLAPRFTREESTVLIKLLLSTASLGNTHLSVAIYDLIAFLCELSMEMTTEITIERSAVDTIQNQRPEVNLTELAPKWISVFGGAIVAHSRHVEYSTRELKSFFTLIIDYLISTEAEVYQAVEDKLRGMYGLIKDEALGREVCGMLGKWLEFKDASPVPYVIRMAGDYCDEAGVEALPSAADLIRLLATSHDGKQAKHAPLIEKTLGRYVLSCGPEAILTLIPLNLDGVKGATPRAWLLPILKETVSHANLEYFSKVLLPLAGNLEAKSKEYQKSGKASDAKVYQVIAHQLWSTLPAFLTFPKDFSMVFGDLAPILGQRLTNDIELRPIIANALTSFIKRSRALENDVDNEGGELMVQVTAKDLEYLSEFSVNFLPVLFNIYGVSDSDQRGYILDCIEAFLSITPINFIIPFVSRVLDRLGSANTNKGSATNSAELVSMLELSAALVRPLDFTFYHKTMATVAPLVSFDDLTVRKRAYRTLGDLLNREDFTPNFEMLEMALLNPYVIQARLDPAVKKGRFRLLLKVIPQLPDDCLHWVPLFLPETILGTKETNQQARLNAFELLIAFARRMSRGGTIFAAKTQGILKDDTNATLDEFMTMLIAGLAGATPQMISATIMALSRVFFEMHQMIDGELLDALLMDIISMLHSNSREVVRSVFGFLKVILTLLSKDSSSNIVESSMAGGTFSNGNDKHILLVEKHLPEFVGGLFNWSNEHNQHFKVRVRHLIERLVRRFGFERIYRLTPSAHQRLLISISKRQKKSKRPQTDQNGNSTDGKKGGEKLEEGGRLEGEFDGMTLAALSKTTNMTRQSNGKVLRSSAKFESAFNDTDSDDMSDDEDEDGLGVPGDSILHDLVDLKDDDEIESVLGRKLSLVSNLAKSHSNKRALSATTITKRNKNSNTKGPLDDDDDDNIRIGEDGKFIIDEGENDESETFESDDEEGKQINEKPKKKVRFGAQTVPSSSSSSSLPIKSSTPKNHKGQRGDAKTGKDKFEPYSYLPMTRATKKKNSNSNSKLAASSKKKSNGKKTPKYFMKRS